MKIKEMVIGGRASSGPPSFLKSFNFKLTWTTQEDYLGPVNCAAYALATFKSTFTRPFDSSQKGVNIARSLQEELGYSGFTSISEIQTFVEKYPQYRVFVLAYVRFNPEASFATSFQGNFVRSLRATPFIPPKS
jgi:hypothetical protein